jgi:sulfite reductase (NADPH) flavoprotein alpha-component
MMLSPELFIPENAPFTTHQRLWLNGYLAGLLAGRGYVPASSGAQSTAPVATMPLLVLFGSQTGTAEKLARHIAREARGRG